MIFLFWFFFFFQAEDGIRDRTVTGVQTCALPIFIAGLDPRLSGTVCASCCHLHRGAGTASAAALRRSACEGLKLERSEERRVGKECSSRGAADEEKKKERESSAVGDVCHDVARE